MTTNPTEHRRPSLLAQHVALLGLDGARPAEGPENAGEAARIRGLRLPPLVLPPRAPTTYHKPMAWLSFAVACGLAALLLMQSGLWRTPDPSDRLRVKGESKVWVYWERDGEVQLWSRDTALQNGDRVRAEVLAAEDLTAYLSVRSGDGAALGDPDEKNALRLKAGEKGSFAGSVKLVGPNEGEVLVVTLCAADDRCSTQEFPLRPKP